MSLRITKFVRYGNSEDKNHKSPSTKLILSLRNGCVLLMLAIDLNVLSNKNNIFPQSKKANNC